jgi:uncharacterized protein (DUF885 family)
MGQSSRARVNRVMDRRNMMIGTVAAAIAGRAARLGAADGPSSRALNALFDKFMQEDLDLSPLTATEFGLDSGARATQRSQVDDSSLAAIAKQKQVTASQLARLQAFDRNSLSRADATSYDVVMYGLRSADTAGKAFAYGPGEAGHPYVISQFDGSYQYMPSFLDSAHPIQNTADCDAYLARLSGFATLLDQETEVARHDLALGVVPPDFALVSTLAQMQQLRIPAPEKSSLTESVARRAQEHHIAGDYAHSAAQLVRDKVFPALDRQIALLHDMQKVATDSAGVWKLPKGAEYYAASLVKWATTSRAPADIHREGLQLVKEQGARADQLMRKQGMTQGSVGERMRAMYKDPRYLYPNTDAGKAVLLADLNRRVASVWTKLPAWFGVLPKAKVEIRRMPKEQEAASSHYEIGSLDGKRAGIYWINLRDTGEQPKWLLPTLTYHESIPGHHLQLSIQQEAGLPLIRKVVFFSGYAEGWALYAEQLAGEIGEYDADPLGQIGQLHDSLLRAVRLVVDTGLHNMKWSREHAIGYYMDSLGDPKSTAISEVERYCVWPGQACAYMLGKLQFLALRERSKRRLGAKFDIRKFHDAVLLPGAMPLDMLDQLSV